MSGNLINPTAKSSATIVGCYNDLPVIIECIRDNCGKIIAGSEFNVYTFDENGKLLNIPEIDYNNLILLPCSEKSEAPKPTCFLNTYVDPLVEGGFLNGNSTGHRLVSVYDPQISQLLNANNDAANEIDGYSSHTVIDTDGIPSFVGRQTKSIKALPDISRSDGNGHYLRSEAIMYCPAYYHSGAQAGWKVNGFFIYDSSSNTSHSDRNEIFVGMIDGNPSPSRSTCKSVAVANTGLRYEVDIHWQGRFFYIVFLIEDAGGQVHFMPRVELELINPTTNQIEIVNNIKLDDWLWSPENRSIPMSHFKQRMVSRYTLPSTGATVWYDGNGSTLMYETINRRIPLQECDCSILPITYDLDRIGNNYVVSNITGGSGSNYTVRWDGNTDPSGATSNLTYDIGNSQNDVDVFELSPVVFDENGLHSEMHTAVVNANPIDVFATPLRVTDTVSSISSSSNNPDEDGGWTATATTISSSYFRRNGSTGVRANAIADQKANPAVLKTGKTDITKADSLRVLLNMVKGGNWSDSEGWRISYSLDDEPKVAIYEHEGNWEIAGEVSTGDTFMTQAFNVKGKSNIRLFLEIWGTGNFYSNLTIYDLRVEEVNS